jgi:hypothetical protein
VFPDNVENAAWEVQPMLAVNATPDALGRSYASAVVSNSIAAERLAQTAPYVGTAAVARDMLAISELHGFEKLQYWGMSYGTVLVSAYQSLMSSSRALTS